MSMEKAPELPEQPSLMRGSSFPMNDELPFLMSNVRKGIISQWGNPMN
jgi:hypothetical protein